MNEEIGRIDVLGNRGEGIGVEEIGLDHGEPSSAVRKLVEVGFRESASIPDQAHHLVTRVEKGGKQAESDVAVGPGEQYCHFIASRYFLLIQ